MRHNLYGKHLGRNKNERTSLFRGLVRQLFLHGSIETTQTKSKAIKGLVDTLIVSAKAGTPGQTRSYESFLPRAEVRAKLIEIAGNYPDRNSGFTNVVKMGKRLGDGAMVVKMSLVEASKGTRVKKLESSKTEIKTEKNSKLKNKKERSGRPSL
mgnify:CR=1 FL=1